MAEAPISSKGSIVQKASRASAEVSTSVTGLRELIFIAIIVVLGISAAAVGLIAHVKLLTLGNTLREYQTACEQVTRNIGHLIDGVKDNQLNAPAASFILARIQESLAAADRLAEDARGQIEQLNQPVVRRLATLNAGDLKALGNNADIKKLREVATDLVKHGPNQIRTTLANIDLEMAIAIRFGDHLDELRYRVDLASQLSHRSAQPLLVLMLGIGASVLIGIWAVWLRALKPGIAALQSSNAALEFASKSLQEQNLVLLHRELESLAAQRIAKFGYWVFNQTGEIEGSEGLAQLLSMPHNKLPRTLQQLAGIGRPTGDSGNRTDDDILANYLELAHKDGTREFTRVVEGGSGRDRIIRERVESTLDPVTGSRHLIGIMLDVSELAEAQSRAAHAEKLDSIGILTGIIAHDFNNVLAVVKASIELTERNPETGLSRLAAMRRAVANATALINRLNAITKDEIEEQELLDPRPVILEAVKLFKSNALNASRVELDLQDGHAQLVRINKGRLENAVLNLLLNAREASAGSMDCVVRVACHIENNPQIDGRDGKRLSGQFVRIDVRDNGAGMRADVLRRAVDPFYSTKPYHTTLPRGLGLWSVYQVVRSTNGDFSITSAEGRGTSVVMLLPHYSLSAPATPIHSRSQELPSKRSNVALLVVDDAEDLLAVIAEQLQVIGYETYTAPSIPVALKILAKEHDIDVVLSDVNLRHGETGLQLATHIRKTYPDISIIFMSGFPVSSQDGGEHADITVVRKPIDIDTLDYEIQHALDSERRKPGRVPH